MAFHRWDSEYYEKVIEEQNKKYFELNKEQYDLYQKCEQLSKELKELHTRLEKDNRPILFLQHGAVELDDEKKLNCFNIVYYNAGYNMPIIYELKQYGKSIQ